MTISEHEQTKSVEWAYYSSPNAHKLGFPGGCWVVAVDGKALKGFLDRDEAMTFAKGLPQEWDWTFLQIKERS